MSEGSCNTWAIFKQREEDIMYKLANGSSSSGYKEGDKFIVGAGEGVKFSAGSIVELESDDYSECPFFTLIKGDCDYKEGAFVSWKYLTPVIEPFTAREIYPSPRSIQSLITELEEKMGDKLKRLEFEGGSYTKGEIK